jgi:aldehyde:ferredoxin oxidoreductase
MKKYHNIGTAANVSPLNKLMAIPVMNLKKASSPKVEEISGEKLVEGYLGRRVACAHCPVACVHIAALREPYEKEPYFFKTSMISYDYELVYSLGSMLGIFEIEGFLKLLDTVEAWGLDAMSVGVSLAWATEAYEKELITEKETMGLKLNWGDYETYMKAIEFVARNNTDFYKALAKGVEYVSSIYGGEDYALSFGSTEMAGYHTGPLCYVNYLTGMRHSHLDSAGYSLDQRMLNKGYLLNPGEAAELLFREESWRQILSSLVICFFARGIYDGETIASSLKVVGINLDDQGMFDLGSKILEQKMKFKYREGFSPENFRIPSRILETKSPHGRIDEEYIRKTIEAYYSFF